MREAGRDRIRWWIDKGVDGFRFDVVNLPEAEVLEILASSSRDSGRSPMQ